jgi:regulatory protein
MPRQRQGPHGTAKDRALRLLAVRWRSRAELERRLRQAGFPPDEVATALQDLERAGLIDDERFARAVVADRADRRLGGDRDVRRALLQHGVSGELMARVMTSAEPESDRALALARKRASRIGDLEPVAAYRRLFGLLVRRGFGPEVARQAAQVALTETLTNLAEAQEQLGEV